MPALNVIATMELPGMKMRNIPLTVTENMLEVKAETKEEEKEEREGYKFWRSRPTLLRVTTLRRIYETRCSFFWRERFYLRIMESNKKRRGSLSDFCHIRKRVQLHVSHSKH